MPSDLVGRGCLGPLPGIIFRVALAQNGLRRKQQTLPLLVLLEHAPLDEDAGP